MAEFIPKGTYVHIAIVFACQYTECKHCYNYHCQLTAIVLGTDGVCECMELRP